MKKLFFLLSLVILLSSCATKYHRKSITGGYSDIQIDKNTFQVSFKGNSRTSMERSVDFGLLRSAELTINNGYKYFTILKGNRFLKEDYNYGIDDFGPYTHIVLKPRIHFKIKCYTNKPEKHSYNAVLLANSIRDKYRIK